MEHGKAMMKFSPKEIRSFRDEGYVIKRVPPEIDRNDPGTNMLSESQFCRRLHAIADLSTDLFHQLGQVLNVANLSTEYLIDLFPVEVCDNIRIK